jgi:hypothetical protein
MATLTTSVQYNGAIWVITATEAAGGGIVFDIKPGEGNANAGDLRGLFLDLENIDTGDTLQSDTDLSDGLSWSNGAVLSTVPSQITEVQWGEDLVVKLGQGANMKGDADPDDVPNENDPPAGYPGPDIFDLGIEFGEPGAGENDNDFVKQTSFTVTGIALSDIADQYFGLRITSTDPSRKGSLKLVGQFPSIDGGGGDDLTYQGFTRGSWLNGSRSDDLTGLFEGSPPTYEVLFLGGDTALTFTSAAKGSPTLTNPTLRQVLDLNGGGLNQFAAQSTAAYLNALYLGTDDDPLTAYSLTAGKVKELTAAVLNGRTVDLRNYCWYVDTNGVKGFQEAGDGGDTIVEGSAAMGMNDLSSLFDFYNNFGTDPADFMLNPCPPELVVT